MSLSKYAYVNARIGGMKAKLLKEDKIRAILEAKSIDELVSIFKDTPYAEYIDAIENLNMINIEKALKKSLYGDYIKLLNSMKAEPMEFLEAYAKRFEISVVKSIIKMKVLKTELQEYLIPFGEITEDIIKKFLSKQNLSEAIEELKETSYYPVLKTVIEEAKKSIEEKSDEEIEKMLTSRIDNYYFSLLNEKKQKLSRKDIAFVNKFIGLEIDLANILNALRLRNLSVDIEEHFMQGGIKITEEIFKKITRIEELEMIKNIIPKEYQELVAQAVEEYKKTKSTVTFEVLMKARIIEESRKIFLGIRFHIGVVLAYLNLKENEIQNLIKIIRLKEEEIPPREIEKFIVIP